MKDYIARELRHLLQNLSNGVRTSVFLRDSFDRYQPGVDQIYWLVGFYLLLRLATDWIWYLPHPEFSIYGLYSHAVRIALMVVGTFLVAKVQRDPGVQVRLLVVLASVAPAFYLVVSLVYSLWRHHFVVGVQWTVLHVLIVGWSTAVLVFILGHFSGRNLGRTLKVLGIYALIVIAPAYLVPRWVFWVPHRTNNSSRYAQLYSEKALYLQDRLVRAATAHLRAGTRHRPDVYFVGFAGYGSQDVFMKEVQYATRLFERRFHAQGRTVALINNLKTLDATPLATETNLKRVLRAIGRRMNPEDFLFLYMTSHGSRTPRLSVSMWPYNLEQISPQALRAMLDRAGIRNRVLMISACYSGGFVAPLENDNTVVITAAAPDRTSFGCSNERDFTYFGEALLAGELKHDSSLLKAFRNTLGDIHVREKREHLESSNPQLFVGRNMTAKLRVLDRVLRAERAVKVSQLVK